MIRPAGIALIGLALAGCGRKEESTRIAPLLAGLGDYQFTITTKSPEAQRYFNQGLVLAYGFNHAEAARSFQQAARLDPACAMAYWGEALVLGPNINAPMEASNVPEAWRAVQKAKELAPGASAKEQALISALAVRYTPEVPDDRAPLNLAYANAMREIYKQYPDDDEAATLFAEALMDTTPWNYWEKDGKPKAETVEILAALETVLKRSPGHPGANHYYIHAVEAQKPELGVPAADRLLTLVPGAGHLVHMPSHIYMRVGRYHDASRANQMAIEADNDYVAQCHAQGLYPAAYMPHNRHFLAISSAQEGRRETSINASRHMAAHIDHQMMRQDGYGTLQQYWIMPRYLLVRFGQWDAILQEPEPARELIYPRGVYHYARGFAFIRKGELDSARREHTSLKAILADPDLKPVTFWDTNSAEHVLSIADDVLAGEIAAAAGDYNLAVRHLESGARKEDELNYNEPPDWYFPVRHSLGAILLDAGRPAQAERVYREDLKRNPENGWALFGLHQSLIRQNKTREAAAVKARFDKAWERADVQLTASRY
ncbi:MAG: hypothetical protein ACK5AZ_14440 [Bryobacteraceae bacterium]